MSDENKGTVQEGVSITIHPDGAVEVPIDGKNARFVRETDLLAVKSGKEKSEKDWGTERSKFQTDLAESIRLREESHSQLLQAQTANTTLTEQFKDHDTIKARVSELETNEATGKDVLTKLEADLTARISRNLINAGATAEILKDKTLDQLRNLEEAAKIFGGNGGKPPSYDTGKGGGGSAPESALDRAKRILAENEEKGHRMGSRSTAPRT